MEGGNVTLEHSTTLSGLDVIWQNIASGLSSSSGPVVTDASVERELAGEYQYTVQVFLQSVSTTRNSEAIVVGENCMY